ncbi:MAG: HU family DNA-binding protein [Bacteroidaceae bacterium]|nr:HU family DNA-binding protein [Bacteroidaceae bacterium]
MERLQIREISRQLAQSQHISIGDAERFVTEMFGTIYEGLKQDKQVIINGFGTFKLTTVKEKETVVFTPDTEIAQQINAPFANFKTVEITADVSDEELGIETADKHDTNTSDEAIIHESSSYALEETNDTNASEPDIPAVEEKVDALTEKVEALTEEIENKKKNRKRSLIAALLFVLIALIGTGGYFYNQHQIKQAELAENKRIEAQKKAEIKHKQDSINAVKKQLNAIDLTDEQKRQIVGEGKADAPVYPCAKTLEQALAILPVGGYTIVGTDKVVEVKEGQELQDIAIENGLPTGECYIQAHNALESVKEGQKIRIPLLKKK